MPRSYISCSRFGLAIIKQVLKKICDFGIRIKTKMFFQTILMDSREKVCGVIVRDGYEYPDAKSKLRNILR
jgi:hypothetical protein